jgi:katanin p60 ATPase-containing subunit A1
MVLATTNCPWDLDDAMRRRLEKRIYIPLPDYEARVQLFEICLKKIPVADDVSAAVLAQLTDGYSGSDVLISCRDASMMPMRRLLTMMSTSEIAEMRAEGNLTVPKVMMADFRTAIQNTRPSVAQETCARYVQWEKDFSNK